MTLPAVGDVAYPSHSQILGQVLADIRHEGARRGVEIDVSAGSDVYVRADKFCRRLSVPIANNKIALRNYSPLTALGADLTALAEQYGVPERPASSGAGALIVSLTGVSSVVIPAGFVAVAPNGSTYKTIAVATVSNGGVVSVISQETGLLTNQAAATILQWADSGIGGLVQTCVVSGAGITGGANKDDEEAVRRRLLRALAAPAVGGNWSSVAQWAEDSSASIETAFVYPAVQGPGSYDVAVMGAGATRTLDVTIVDAAKAAIVAQMPGHAELNVTGVVEQQVDVVIDALLPDPILAGGVGGGWLDGTQWPNAVAGQAPSLLNTPTLTFNGATLTRSTGTWLLDRFLAGMQITVTGTVSNNGTYTIVSIDAASLVITISGTFVAETLVVAPNGTVTSTSTVPTMVTSVSGVNIQFSSAAADPPVAGRRIAIFVPATKTFTRLTITTATTTTPGAHFAQVSQPSLLTQSLVGCYVSADCEFIQTYYETFRDEVYELGPGEKSGSLDVLPRGKRHPPPETEAPSAMASALLGKLTEKHAELTDVAYGARLAAGSITGRPLATVPAAAADPPNVLTLNRFAIRSA